MYSPARKNIYFRTGKIGKLTVRKQGELGNEVKEEVSGEVLGTFTVLELNKDTSKFYVGGLPYGVDVRTILLQDMCLCINT